MKFSELLPCVLLLHRFTRWWRGTWHPPALATNPDLSPSIDWSKVRLPFFVSNLLPTNILGILAGTDGRTRSGASVLDRVPVLTCSLHRDSKKKDARFRRGPRSRRQRRRRRLVTVSAERCGLAVDCGETFLNEYETLSSSRSCDAFTGDSGPAFLGRCERSCIQLGPW